MNLGAMVANFGLILPGAMVIQTKPTTFYELRG